MLGAVEDQMLVDLITDHQDVVIYGEPGDLRQLVVAQYGTGRIVR